MRPQKEITDWQATYFCCVNELEKEQYLFNLPTLYMFHNFITTEPKRSRSSSESDAQPSNRPKVEQEPSQEQTEEDVERIIRQVSLAGEAGPSAVVTEEKSISDRLKSLKKTRKKEYRLMNALFHDVNAVYADLSMQLKMLLDGFDSKSDELGSRDKAREWMQKKAAKRAEKGKPSGFDQGFLGFYEMLDQLVGPDGITYREAYRGPVKRSWHVTGLQISSVDDLDSWNNQPIYIMWERRAPRQTSGAAGGAKKKSNYNDYDEDDKPHLTWELPTSETDIMSSRAGRRALFSMGRLVIVIEKFKDENPANRSEIITQHRIKGVYVVLRTPRRDDVKLCLIESRHFIEHVCVGKRVDNVWFFDQQVVQEPSSDQEK